MVEICHDVQVEFFLHAISSEVIGITTGLCQSIDISFQRCLHCRTFLMVVFLIFLQLPISPPPVATTSHRHDAEKCRAYQEQI